MRIIINDRVRKNISDDEYKLLLLLEFHQDFLQGLRNIRKKLDIKSDADDETITHLKEVPDQKALQEEVFLLAQRLNLPVTLTPAIESLVQWGTVLLSTIPILVFSVDHQLNRRFLYSDQILPKPRTSTDDVNLEKKLVENWYERNKQILSKSIAPAYPVIQINKRLTKEQLIKAVKINWENISKAMDDFEKSVPLYLLVSKVPKKDIEINILVLRYREEGLSHEEIYDKLERDHKIIFALGEAEVRRKYSLMRKLLKELGYLK